MSNIIYMIPRRTSPIVLYRSKDGTLIAERERQVFERVKLVRAFPHSFPDQFISVRSELGEEIYHLHDLTALDECSQHTAKEELDRCYLVPNIQRIESIRNLVSVWSWQVDTDFGRMAIMMDNLFENIHVINAGRWIITDIEGRRYMLSDVEQMDVESQQWWSKVNENQDFQN